MLKVDYFKRMFFVLIPITFVILGIITRDIRGPYYRKNGDPEYAYHASAMSVATFQVPTYVDHPGVPVHVLGGFLYRLKFLFASETESEFTVDAIKHTHEYLTWLGNGINLLSAIFLFGIGLMIFRLSNSVLFGFLGQVSLLGSPLIINSLARARAEPMLIFHGILVVFFVLKFLSSKRDILKLNDLVAPAIGFGIATKLTFLPLVFLPVFLFRSLKQVFLYPVHILLGFIAGTFVVLPEYPRFIVWVYRLIRYSGRYGQGSGDLGVTFEQTQNRFSSQIARLFSFGEDFFGNSLLLMVFAFGVYFLIRNRGHWVKLEREHKLMLGAGFSFFFSLLIVSKHPGGFYTLPVYTLLPLAVLLVANQLTKFLGKTRSVSLARSIGRFAIPIVSFFILGVMVFTIGGNQKKFSVAFDTKNRDEMNSVNQLVEEKYSQCALVGYYGVSSPYTGLDIFYRNGGHVFKSQIEKALPKFQDTFIYSVWGEGFYKIADSSYRELPKGFIGKMANGKGKEHMVVRHGIQDIESYFSKYPCVVLQGPSFTKRSMASSYNPPTNKQTAYEMKDIFEGKTQTLYEFTKKE